MAIKATDSFDEPPEWAVLQRRLIAEMNDAVDPLFDRYIRDDGSIMWPPGDDYVGMDALDDAYESFHNWPLFYALGGDKRIFDLALKEWEAITEQFAEIPTGAGHPQVIKEYQQGHDWFHQSEGNHLFYHLCMADPMNEALIDRARRFSGFYLNKDIDIPDIYDEEHALVKCPMNGSAGPAYHNFSDEIPPPMYHAHSETRIPWQYSEWKERYGLPFYDLEGIDTVADLKDPKKARRMGEAIRDRCARGDCPQNLGITSLLTNAYLLTGEETYREWVIEYVDAWIERTERNGGLLPDNVGPSDEIGERLNGRWFGGWYGWTWPHGWRSLGNAVLAGAENAMLLTGGDLEYLNFPRSQLAYLEEKGLKKESLVEIPYRYATEGSYPSQQGQELDDDETEGWFDFRPARSDNLTHLWYFSRKPKDRDRIERLHHLSKKDWETEELQSGLKTFGGNEFPWVAFLEGDFPEYPRRILRHNLNHVRTRLEFMESDEQDPATYDDYYLARRNPITTEALLQCTVGAPLGLFNGGLSVSLLRHFDPDEKQPGLPEGVAALVSSINPSNVTLELVNVDTSSQRVLVQAGGFGQHRFTSITGGECSIASEKNYVEISLDPESQIVLEAEIDRFVTDPSYVFPWHDT